MNIEANTKLSALIKVNPEAVEAIASINRNFEKLRNPLLRKILASRVTIADAARIGGCGVEDFFEKLAPLGFTTTNKAPAVQPKETIAPKPAFLAQLPLASIISLDVCEDITKGNDPFLKIMSAVDALNRSNALLLINTFEPAPLIAILHKKGYACYTEPKGPDLVHTYFWLAGDGSEAHKATETTAQEQTFEEALTCFGDRVKNIDVRHLQMPQPMVTILSELEQLPAGWALHVNHRRVPQLLLPQLEERGFTVAILEAGPGEVYLLIHK
ncbi:DUF2249 domain-containing protein [Pontibacter sp. E15-1]|uniref:DUF2249 domain-containing protein n=1 Tax=Pontibacter sp. E15-1 TaxID=2919918 RepID=UPI001F4FF07B|nr:DUF2249 domain-containing protein [Pontibacter sp. E15-1]MCJ8163303.1 DUF2249 domain-containing protein [Pontibacter sp. E15-1]